MISRRFLMASLPAAAMTKGADAAMTMSPSDRLEAMVRMRASTDGRLCAGWLDAVRLTVIDGEIVPFCRLLAGSLCRFEKHGDLYEATILEVAYYLHPETGVILGTFQFPGTSEAVRVPAYSAGPTKVRFSAALDEWEENDPVGKGQASVDFAPKAWIHLERSVGVPIVDGESLYLRADEYGRVYPDRAAPPTIFYREWMIWRAAAQDILKSRAPSVSSDYTYAALSSWRPWMRMGEIKGHTAENGRGAKVDAPGNFPPELRDLVARRDPDVLRNPARALG